MNCPYCSRPMMSGHITGKNILRIIPESGASKRTEHPIGKEALAEFQKTNLPGYPLDIPYAGMAPWVSAEYCLRCKKVVCILDIADPGEVKEP